MRVGRFRRILDIAYAYHPGRTMKLSYLLLAASFLIVACEKDVASTQGTDSGTEEAAAPDPESLIQPRFSIGERHELTAVVQMSRVMKTESRGEKTQPSETLRFNLTVEPKGDEVHFIWSSPEVDAMPTSTDEEKAAAVKAAFERMWSPSFAVSKQGKFLRILDADAIKAGFDASMQARIDAGADREQVEKMAASNDPIEVMETVGKRRWAEIVGHFLVNEFVKNETVKSGGSELSATTDIDCLSGEAGGECVRFVTSVPVPRREVEKTLGAMPDDSTKIKSAMRVATLVAKPDQMLPWYSESKLDLELEVVGPSGVPETVTSQTIETIDLEERTSD